MGDRRGLRHRQHEPFHDEDAVRRPPARARRPRLFQADDADRLGAQHAGGELPVAVRERRLGGQSRIDGPVRPLREPEPARGVLCPRAERRRGVARRRDDQRDRQQLRDAARRRSLRPRTRQASEADAVSAEERAAPDGDERRRKRMSDLRAAVAAGVFGTDEAFRALLQSTVATARAIFHAKASSAFLLDEETDELVFEAVAGEGADTLVGRRFPSSTGVAGWVLVTRQPLVVDDLSKDTRFSRDAAASTGYVPRGLMAAPLLVEDRALGVLEVLDRPAATPFTLAEMDLLGLFANQAAIALDLLQRARRAQAALGGEGELAALGRFAARLEEAPEETRAAGLELLAALDRLLGL